MAQFLRIEIGPKNWKFPDMVSKKVTRKHLYVIAFKCLVIAYINITQCYTGVHCVTYTIVLQPRVYFYVATQRIFTGNPEVDPFLYLPPDSYDKNFKNLSRRIFELSSVFN